MRIAVFTNQLGLGGSENAACLWSRELLKRGHEVQVISLTDGPRRNELEKHGINPYVVQPEARAVRTALREIRPDVIHTHAPGYPHQGDVLGSALAGLPKIPVLQTNVFGQLRNPAENSWTDFRLFISWTSCVQAARRAFQPLDEAFFRRASVAVYPLDPDDGPASAQVQDFRRLLDIDDDEVVFGRLSRPERNKWTDLPIKAFRIALQKNPRLKLLLREPPPEVARHLTSSTDRDRFLVLPVTAEQAELKLTMASLDVVLHTSLIGESFGYGIAEPMNLRKPVIANSTPGLDQAQIELVRHGECGFIASTAPALATAILRLANDANLRSRFGNQAKAHIRKLANPTESTDRLEEALHVTIRGQENPKASADLTRALATADYLDEQQFGHSLSEEILLRSTYYRTRFHQWRQVVPKHFFSQR